MSKVARTESGGGVASNYINRSLADREAEEEASFKTGPFRLLYDAVHNPRTKVVVSCRNEKKLIGNLRAFDRHFNLLLEGVNEFWVVPGAVDENGDPEHRTGCLPYVFLRGDTVILVAKVKDE